MCPHKPTSPTPTLPPPAPRFQVGDTVRAAVDITNNMLVSGDDTVIVPKGAGGVVLGLSSDYMMMHGFDLEVRFEKQDWYVSSGWLERSPSLADRIIEALETERVLMGDNFVETYVHGYDAALRIVRELVAADAHDAGSGREEK